MSPKSVWGAASIFFEKKGQTMKKGKADSSSTFVLIVLKFRTPCLCWEQSRNSIQFEKENLKGEQGSFWCHIIKGR
jgi:hypothetical protein